MKTKLLFAGSKTRLLTLLTTFILLSILCVGNIYAADKTINGSDITGFGSGSNYTSGSYDAGDGFTISSSNGFSTTQFRVAKSATMTIALSTGKITKIVFTASSTSYKLNADGITWSNSTGTYTNASGTNSITFTNSSANIARITKIVITYTAGVTKYTVTYNANGATSGSVPTDATEYTSGTSVTVKGNTGNLAKTGYNFAGWNTKNDGTGTNYTAGTGTFSISANTTLYAKWTAKSIVRYLTQCCTPLGAINGSISLTNESNC